MSRKARRDARMNDLAAEFGGVEALSPGDRRFLTEAVDLLLSIKNTTSDNDKVRIVNATNRIVQGIRSRHATAKRANVDPWLVELIDHEDRAQANAPGSARDGMCVPATPLAGGSNERASERPCACGEHFEGEGDDHSDAPERGDGETLPEEEPFERRVQRARIGDIVRVGDVEIEIIADDEVGR
jgi:hypothetical protein